MGSFFTSPKERASTNMYDMAMQGKTFGSGILDSMSNLAKSNLEAQTSQRLATTKSDLQSRMASSGTPVSAGTGLTTKATTPIIAGEQNAMSEIDIARMNQAINMLFQQLSMGMSGLSSSSTFGDVMGGMTTIANIVSGVAGMGGANGFNWWGSQANNISNSADGNSENYLMDYLKKSKVVNDNPFNTSNLG
jgi:hypothetical protein